ncbi:ABC transporter substrate-binding protein [Ectopseudomonas guguanensis]|jgi:ABC transporter substrate binding protein (PQQ-dependent alcohol dehydrogenase system)|uniref:ABC transporter, substrate binding protein, PQQ-dependent alcohol dehydrogenase system n=1 Tax=Ectopseudomonas guguanensis TaxID=1198456 RepID=A0A1H0VXE8_9GAMM|nr:ABC transporter substrate-binding protein [Pseudomonas guguanensis]SDP83104.1 ABC transporter, substrate binding protein, PQQ-dependent alcohol dehydrogenase system [Pseudomonas guguanensis]
MHRISCRLLFCLAAAFGVAAGSSANELQVRIGYLAHLPPRGPLLSNVIPEPSDAGRRGAELAIIDSNSTGRFLKQQFELQSAESDQADELLAAAERQHQAGIRLFVVNAPAATLRQLSQRLPDSLLFNAGSADDGLRRAHCLGNVLHTLPSRAMLADALAQFLAVRKWTRWLLVTGSTEDDIAYADALKRAAKRFGHRIVAEKPWSFDTDQRRSAQAEMPLFTQASEYDVVLVADERGDFGEYLPYNTWYPRPVAGTQGLTPTAWHKTVETFGAAQLQKRFEELAGRWMNDRDFAAWMAVRSVAAAVTKLRAADPQAIRHLLLNEQLPLDGFKGRKLSFRPWNGELRQPIPLVHPRALVSTSPQDGFLHPSNEMDSLGYDRPEVKCDLAGEAG